MRATFLLILGIVALSGCKDTTAPTVSDEAGNFRIVLAQPVYTQADLARSGIRATVTNASKDRDFYANVGDGFDRSLEQPTIFAAVGTQAVIEQFVSGVWKSASAGMLIEGSRFVVLRAGQSYSLHGSIVPNTPGTYRIRLDYSERNNDPSATILHDYSAAFLVR